MIKDALKYNSLYFDRHELPSQYRIVCGGRYEEYEWCIVSMGSHPDAYIGIPLSNPIGRKFMSCEDLDDLDMSLSCHGGITYNSFELEVFKRDHFHEGYIIETPEFLDIPRRTEKCIWIGWDYSHLGDLYYAADYPQDMSKRKIWTENEIMSDILKVIRELNEYKLIHG